MQKKKALIAGATGLVGNELLQILLRENRYESVCAVVRRPLGIKHPQLQEVICDFGRLEAVKEYFAVDDVFCCLGTTIKKAQTKEAMYRVDVEYPVALAKLAKDQGASHFLAVSAANAGRESIFWYPRIKGELEEAIKNIPFAAISIFRPSLLLGTRTEFRLLERLASGLVQLLARLLGRPMPVQVAIEARVVAQAMYRIARLKNNPGVRIYAPRQMAGLAAGVYCNGAGQ